MVASMLSSRSSAVAAIAFRPSLVAMSSIVTTV
jgi:hypothetical protein